MRISKLRIHNWRSIKDCEVDFQSLMIFIGQNNHGKSNILTALLFFFGYISISEMDFNKGSEELHVEVTFCDLDDHDKNQFKKYLTSEGAITVRKQVIKGDPPEYHGYCQIPSDSWLREESAGQLNNRDVIQGTPLLQYIPHEGRVTKEMVIQAQRKYIEDHTGSVNFLYQLEHSHFLGLKSVAQGIFGQVFFVPAVKNVGDEFNIKSKSIFSQLFSNVINEMSKNNDAYKDAKKRIAELAQNLNKTVSTGAQNQNRPAEISKLESLLEDELRQWDTKISIEITPPDIDEVMRLGTSVWVDDGVPTDVDRKGNGLQRSLIFALIKAWVKASTEISEEQTLSRSASKSIYLFYEEPELYLHPQAQRELFSSLQSLSESGTQVVLSTHSSSFLDLEAYKSIVIVYKKNLEEGSKTLQCSEELFTLSDDKKNFNMTYWLNPDRSELFFAKKVILLEGATEKTVIPYLAKKIGIFRYDYTLIDCGSKDSIQVYVHLLNKFKISYLAVYDKDHQSGKSSEALQSADQSSAKIESTVNRSIGDSVIFINDLDEEIGITQASDKHKPYLALNLVSAQAFEIPLPLKSKIEKIYS